MKDMPSLDDLALLLSVADCGSLARAADITGVSVPTLSRRMTALEKTLGQRLFERGKHGYRLTADGRVVAARAEVLRGVAAGCVQDRSLPRVRVTAGLWTARFLVRHLAPVADGHRIDFVASNARVDLARREADIGIRNARPDQPWLAAQRTGQITYAYFAATVASVPVATCAPDAAQTPSEKWVHATTDDHARLHVSSPLLGLDLALAGQVRVLVPTFVGAAEPGLTQISDLITDLSHDEWLVSHHDARHDPPIRAALDRIAALLTNAVARPTERISPP